MLDGLADGGALLYGGEAVWILAHWASPYHARRSMRLLPRHRELEALLGADQVVDVLSRGVNVDLHPFDLAVELVPTRAIVFRDRLSHIAPDLQSLIQREDEEMRAFD